MAEVWAPGTDNNFKQDWFDRRDAIYLPSLRPLKRGSDTISLLRAVQTTKPAAGSSSSRPLPFRISIRNQQNDATCSGQSLAALIDIMRLIRSPDTDVPPVSARMLYEMARNVEGTRGVNGVQTLRAAVKGFWHNGVCLDDDWPDDDVSTDNILTVHRAKCAREITLGAYFRVRTLLRDFHSAISEAGAILVAAQVHTGWARGAVKKNKGRINNRDNPTNAGAHAFVVVGWDRDGFLVLNSSGPEWGHFDGLRGIAHWSYQDWSERVLDAWVLQLGAPTPDAFDMCQCPQGHFGGLLSIEENRTIVPKPSTPRSHLLGHYAHLDDGRHVNTGTFPTSNDDVIRTFELVKKKNDGPKPEPLLLWLAGGIEGLDGATGTARIRKHYFEKLGFYFYTILWCQDAIDAARPVLGLLFDLAIKKAGSEGEGAAETMQAVVRGIGRAVWRDLHNAAKLSAKGPAHSGDAFRIFDAALSTTGGPVHIVADGLGAVLLKALFDTQTADIQSRLASLVLVAPAIKVGDFETTFAPIMRYLGANKSAVILPSEEFDRRMVTGPYPYSILHLAAEAFEDLEGGRPPVMTGASSTARKLRKMIGRPSVLTIKPPDEPMTFEHSDLTSSPDVLDHVATICTHNAKHR